MVPSARFTQLRKLSRFPHVELADYLAGDEPEVVVTAPAVSSPSLPKTSGAGGTPGALRCVFNVLIIVSVMSTRLLTKNGIAACGRRMRCAGYCCSIHALIARSWPPPFRNDS